MFGRVYDIREVRCGGGGGLTGGSVSVREVQSLRTPSILH